MNYERYQKRGVLGVGCVDTVLQSFKCKIIVFLHSGNDVVYINTKFNQKLMTINKRKHKQLSFFTFHRYIWSNKDFNFENVCTILILVKISTFHWITTLEKITVT